jgi:caa(3)-type oxidase subunit IV
MSTSHDSHSDPTKYDGLGHHIASLQTYVAVFGSLLFFTALTYAVSFADLGPFALLIAMMVACVKVFLVATFFMHLKYDEKFNVLVFVSSIFFIAVFFGFTMIDLGSRSVITEVEGYHTWWAEHPEAHPAAFGPVHETEATAAVEPEVAPTDAPPAEASAPPAEASAPAAQVAVPAEASAAAPAEASVAAPAAVEGSAAPAAGVAVEPAAAPAAAPAAGH